MLCLIGAGFRLAEAFRITMLSCWHATLRSLITPELSYCQQMYTEPGVRRHLKWTHRDSPINPESIFSA
jgi:hypothetical protein